jgi:undecaprenyl-diphosphatase
MTAKNDMLQWIQSIDNTVIFFVQNYFHNPALDNLMVFLSTIGNTGAVWLLLAALFLFFPRYRKYGVMILLALLFTSLTGEILLKHLVQRVRPCNADLLMPMLISRPNSFSFPSGHTSSSFAAALVIWTANKRFGIFAAVLALLIAFSRLYLFVHYPSDILAGLLLGLLCGALSIRIIDRFYRKFHKKYKSIRIV